MTHESGGIRHGTTFVVVVAEGRSYCIPVRQVREIVADARVTEVPGSPDAIRGVVNVRGRVLALLDLSVALGGAVVDLENADVLVLDSEIAGEMAVAVDEVVDVGELSDDVLRPPPPFGLGGAAPMAVAIAERPEGLAIVLDLASLVEGFGTPGEAEDVREEVRT